MRAWIAQLLVAAGLLAGAELSCRAYLRWISRPELVRAWTVHNRLDQPAPVSGLLPLAGLSRRPTRLCRERDGVVSYLSDRYGFHNDDRSWDQRPDIVLLGDSFVQGHCVPEEAQLASLLAGRTGLRVLNLGLRGSGPFSQLGVLQEYALPMRPRKILWFVLANDFLFDLERELQAPALTGYYEGILQGLRARQKEIDQWVAAQGAAKPFQEEEEGPAFPALAAKALFGALLPEPWRPMEGGDPQGVSGERLALYAGLLRKAKDLAERSGTSIEFIFIPDAWLFTKAQGPALRSLVSQLGQELRKDGIELHDPSPRFAESPFQYFAPLDGYYGHYNAKGFRGLAENLAPLLP